MSAFLTDPITLVTGKQGAGKTLWSIWQADTERERGGVPAVYFVNIEDADPRMLTPLPFPVQGMADDGNGKLVPLWTTLPPGSIIIVDEAHKVFPQRGPGRPPAFVEEMSESRKRGIRWVLVSQAPASIDGFLRDRVNRHFHIEKKLGWQAGQVYEFDRAVDPDRDFRARKEAMRHPFRYPKKYFGAYKSAATHLFRARIPWKLAVAPLFLIGAGIVAWKVVSSVGGLMESGGLPGVPAAAAAEGEASGPAAGRRVTDTRGLSNVAYLEQFVPVVPGMPWSAPAYRDRPVVSEPQVLCVLSGHDGEHGCRCYTEQMTRLKLDEDTCRDFARNGVYNPFREPISQPVAAEKAPGKPSLSASGALEPAAALPPLPAGVGAQPLR